MLCNVQRVVNEEALFVSVALGVTDKLDSSWLSDKEQQPQSVSLLTIY